MGRLESRVEGHYTTPDLISQIDAALTEMGVGKPSIDDLKPIDEFHTGGLEATDALISQLEITPEMRVLDIGAGLGGTARHIVHRYGAHVTGVDLSEAFVDTAKILNDRIGLTGAVSMMHGSATDVPVAAGSSDLVTMFHVGMNIEDKPRLMQEVARVLKPGGHFALFDVMRGTSGDDLQFPLPWAQDASISFVDSPLSYISAAEGAGLALHIQRDRRDFTIDYFDRVFAAIEANGLPPLGIHLLMGETAGEKLRNYVDNVKASRIAPVEMIFTKPG